MFSSSFLSSFLQNAKTTWLFLHLWGAESEHALFFLSNMLMISLQNIHLHENSTVLKQGNLLAVQIILDLFSYTFPYKIIQSHIALKNSAIIREEKLGL